MSNSCFCEFKGTVIGLAVKNTKVLRCIVDPVVLSRLRVTSTAFESQESKAEIGINIIPESWI